MSFNKYHSPVLSICGALSCFFSNTEKKLKMDTRCIFSHWKMKETCLENLINPHYIHYIANLDVARSNHYQCEGCILHSQHTEFTMLVLLPLSQKHEKRDLTTTHRYFFLCNNHCTVLSPDCYWCESTLVYGLESIFCKQARQESTLSVQSCGTSVHLMTLITYRTVKKQVQHSVILTVESICIKINSCIPQKQNKQLTDQMSSDWPADI